MLLSETKEERIRSTKALDLESAEKQRSKRMDVGHSKISDVLETKVTNPRMIVPDSQMINHHLRVHYVASRGCI